VRNFEFEKNRCDALSGENLHEAQKGTEKGGALSVVDEYFKFLLPNNFIY
jgi:hypothetical protein